MGEDDRCGVYGREDVAVFTAAESARFDAWSIRTFGVPERVLMENAGRSAALVLQRLFPRGRVLGFAGGGNNGGDLLVLLRCLKQWGRECALVVAAPREPELALLHGIELECTTAEHLPEYDLLVDGVLGTGAQGAPRGAAEQAILAMEASGKPVLALDVPSGVDGTTGSVPAVAVRAQATVTFGWPKLGLLLHPGRAYVGRLVAVEIAFPPLNAGTASAALITPEWVRLRLPSRAPDAHKGTSGRLLIVAGQQGMAGAAAIAAEAAVRTGTGLVRVASAAGNREIVQGLVPEATFFDRATLPPEPCADITAAVIGPGFGQSAESEAALALALERTAGRPTLIDADALNLLSREAGRLAGIAAERPLVITPHPREAARLLGCSTEQITGDAPAAAGEAAARFGCAVLLKGQPSLVAVDGMPLLLNTAGSSDVAVGGMGDQLAGVIGALLAAGLEPRTAAAAGLFLSSRAADIAGKGRALSPRDVSVCLGAAYREPGCRTTLLELPFVTFDQSARR